MKTRMIGVSGRHRLGAAIIFIAVFAAIGILVTPKSAVGQTSDWYEPNNTRGTASLIYPAEVMEYVEATISPTRDVDFYAFHAYAGDHARIRSDESVDLALFGGTNCASQLGRGTLIEVVLPANGHYCIRVRSANPPPLEDWYYMEFSLYDRFEPNNTPPQATPIRYGESIEATMMWRDGADYYAFTGHAGDLVFAHMRATNEYGPSVYITDSEDAFLGIGPEGGGAKVLVTLPADGTYYVRLQNENYEGFATDCGYELTLDKAITVSTATNGRIGNLSFDHNDILVYLQEADRWEVLDDPAEIGLNNQVSSFNILTERYWGFSVLMSLRDPQELCTVWYGCDDGTGIISINPHDILRSKNYGHPNIYFDGSDVGLTTAGERIDALGVTPDGQILLSTTGNGSVPGVASFSDEDILAFTASQWGSETAGTWSLYFDGSSIPGMRGEDVTGLDIGPDGTVYLLMESSFNISGTQCGPSCIVAVQDNGVVGVWNSRDHGLPYRLDGFALFVGPALPWP